MFHVAKFVVGGNPGEVVVLSHLFEEYYCWAKPNSSLRGQEHQEHPHVAFDSPESAALVAFAADAHIVAFEHLRSLESGGVIEDSDFAELACEIREDRYMRPLSD